MLNDRTSLVGSIVERKPGSPAHVSSPTNNGSRTTGFPPVQHRSKSAFARARENSKNNTNSQRPQQVPTISPSSINPRPDVPRRDASPGVDEVVNQKESDEWRKQMEEENQRRVDSMTDEELEDARREILQKFGFNVGEILQKVRKAREEGSTTTEPGEVSPGRQSPLEGATCACLFMISKLIHFVSCYR